MINILILANEVQDEVDKLIARTFDDPHYKYYHVNGYLDYKSDNTSNWPKEEYVSIDSNGKIVGHFYARIDRNARSVTSLAAINLDRDNRGPLFALDFKRFIEKMLIERGYYKMRFCVITENPAMHMYDKFIERYDGRVVGTFMKDDRLPDGKLYDTKHYEIFSEDFIKAKNRKEAMNDDSNSTSELVSGIGRHEHPSPI